MKRENQIFTAPFMDAQVEKAAWKHLSTEAIVTDKLMSEYGDKLHWKSISKNREIKWNIDLLRKFADYLHWEELTSTLFNCWCSHMRTEKWRIEDVIILIDEFKDRWNWDELSSEIEHPQIEDILEKYASQLKWNKVACNTNIKWTTKMVSKFEQYFANVEDIEDTYLWSELAESRAAEILEAIYNK